MKENYRRRFLKNAALSIGAASMATGMSSCNTDKSKQQKEGTFRLVRDVQMEESWDVVVLGGGPSGCGAAISAARLGAKVLLVEYMGCLGGMGTSGLVTAFDPMGSGTGMLVGGLMKEIVENMYKRGFLMPGIDPDTWRKRYHVWTPFQSEGYKLMLDELCVEAGVEVRFFTQLIDADCTPGTREVNGLVIQNVEGYKYIKAKTFIDCTGDAVLADLVGVKHRRAGKDTDHIMPSTLCALVSNIDWTKQGGKKDYPTQMKLYKKALQEGFFSQYDRQMIAGIDRVGERVGTMNSGHEFGTDALDIRSLSDAMMSGRKRVREHLNFFRERVPGMEKVELVSTGARLGVRESRRILGIYELNIEDYKARRQFPDQIGIFNKFVDIHPYDTSQEEWDRYLKDKKKGTKVRLNAGEFFGIPYGVLVPQEFDNLWVAGRCASADVKVQGSIRVQPACNMMGQAAGTAAVQSINTGQPNHDLNTETLCLTLRDNGDANLPQKKFSKKPTTV